MNRHNSIKQKFEQNINKCDICFSSYDRTLHQPVIICSMHHTICRDCMKSIQSTRLCPFCREQIKFDKIVINNYIFQLLPEEKVQPNIRQQINVPQYNKQSLKNVPQTQNFNNPQPSPRPQFRYPANAYNPQQSMAPPAPQPPAVSINSQPQQRIYSDNYQEQIGYYSQDATNEIQSNRQVYFTIFCLQIPFTFLNLYFSLASPQSQCMDKPHRLTFLIVRPWFLSMGITQAVLMLALIIVILLYRCRCISREAMHCCHYPLGIIALIKIIIWCFAELQLFSSGIARFCSGGVYAYGLILTIIHIIILLIVVCLGGSRRS